MNIEWLKNKEKERFYPVTNAKAVLIGESGKTVDDVLKISTSVVSGDTNLVTGDAVSKAIYTATNYEEGIWTPKLKLNEDYPVYNIKVGKYKKVGKIVFCTAHINITNMYNELVIIEGLPYAIDTSDSAYEPLQGSILINTGLTNSSTGDSREYSAHITKGLYDNSVSASLVQSNAQGWIKPEDSRQQHDIYLNFWYMTTDEKLN